MFQIEGIARGYRGLLNGKASAAQRLIAEQRFANGKIALPQATEPSRQNGAEWKTQGSISQWQSAR